MNEELIARARSLRNHYLGKTEAFRDIVSDVIDELTSALEAAQQAGEPLFWYRRRSDGGYEGPLSNSSIEDVRKKSGAWIPLYTHPEPQVPMTDEEIDEAYLKHQNGPYERAFTAGLKAAEAHHKIGVKP